MDVLFLLQRRIELREQFERVAVEFQELRAAFRLNVIDYRCRREGASSLKFTDHPNEPAPNGRGAGEDC